MELPLVKVELSRHHSQGVGLSRHQSLLHNQAVEQHLVKAVERHLVKAVEQHLVKAVEVVLLKVVDVCQIMVTQKE